MYVSVRSSIHAQVSVRLIDEEADMPSSFKSALDNPFLDISRVSAVDLTEPEVWGDLGVHT